VVRGGILADDGMLGKDFFGMTGFFLEKTELVTFLNCLDKKALV